MKSEIHSQKSAVRNQQSSIGEGLGTHDLTPGMEDYLEAVLYLQNLEGVVRVRDIARHLDVKMPSVSDAIKALKSKSLVRHEPYGHVELTESGELLARALLMRHQQLTHFLRDLLGVDSDTAETDACRIEHVVSAQTMKKLLALSECVISCKEQSCYLHNRRGAASGRMPKVEMPDDRGAGLHTLRKGQKARVLAIDPHKTLRRRLLDLGFTQGAEVEMQNRGEAFHVRVKGYVVALKPHEAELVRIKTA